MRAMTNAEKELTARILGDTGVCERDISLQAMVQQIAPEDLASYHIAFIYPDKPIPEGGYVVMRDWHAKDRDGAPLELLALGGADGRIYEIEILRLDLLPIIEFPAPSMWT